MTWFDYLLIALWLLGMVMTVASVGRPKKPTEATVAAIVVIFDLALIAGLLWTRGVL